MSQAHLKSVGIFALLNCPQVLSTMRLAVKVIDTGRGGYPHTCPRSIALHMRLP